MQHKNRCLALKLITYDLEVSVVFVLSCNNNLLYNVQGSVLVIRGERVLLCTVHMSVSLFAHTCRYWVCVGWRLALSQWLVIQTDVVGRPRCIIWPRCRWRLCSQTLSWKLLLPRTPTAIVFPLTSAQGFPIKNESQGPNGWRVGWFEKTCLNLGVLSGEVLGTACILFVNFISSRLYPVLCFAKACLGLFCYFLVSSIPFSLVMMHGACQKIEQHRVGKNRKDNLKDGHRFKLWLKMCRKFFFHLSAKGEQSQILTF